MSKNGSVKAETHREVRRTVKRLELQLSEARDSYKVMCDRVNELEREIERLRKYQLKVLDDQYRQGIERAAEICDRNMDILAAEAIRAELEPVTENEESE